MWVILGLTILGGVLNRARGAWFRMYVWDSGVAARFAWAIPTALILWYGTTPNIAFLENPYRIVLLVLSCWAMWWLGSGAHSVMNFNKWKEQWDKGFAPDDTEAYTDWVLKKVFKGTPNPLWDEEKFLDFHMLGKSIEGGLRMLIMVLPIIVLAPYASLALIVSGCFWGALFYNGWEASDDDGWAIGEILCGALTYLVIGIFFYG